MENLSIEEMREALSAYYEAAGFADIYDRLSAADDESIRNMYKDMCNNDTEEL